VIFCLMPTLAAVGGVVVVVVVVVVAAFKLARD
jgi:hypothetical protein